MTNNFKEDFNFFSNILILFLLFFGGLVYADSNGIWNDASDLRGGIIGSDEQDVSSFYTFINPVNFNNDVFIGDNSTNYELKVNGKDVQTKIIGSCEGGGAINNIFPNGSVNCTSGEETSEIIPGFVAIPLPSGESFFFLSSDFEEKSFSVYSGYSCDARINEGKLELRGRMAGNYVCGFQTCNTGWVDGSSVPNVQCRVSYCDHGPNGPSRYGPTCTLLDNSVRAQGSNPYVGHYSSIYALS